MPYEGTQKTGGRGKFKGIRGMAEKEGLRTRHKPGGKPTKLRPHSPGQRYKGSLRGRVAARAGGGGAARALGAAGRIAGRVSLPLGAAVGAVTTAKAVSAGIGAIRSALRARSEAKGQKRKYGTAARAMATRRLKQARKGRIKGEGRVFNVKSNLDRGRK